MVLSFGCICVELSNRCSPLDIGRLRRGPETSHTRLKCSSIRAHIGVSRIQAADARKLLPAHIIKPIEQNAIEQGEFPGELLPVDSFASHDFKAAALHKVPHGLLGEEPDVRPVQNAVFPVHPLALQEVLFEYREVSNVRNRDNEVAARSQRLSEFF